jgi:hypothetical protein
MMHPDLAYRYALVQQQEIARKAARSHLHRRRPWR